MIKVEWDNPEKTIVRLDYFDPVESWEEYQNAVKESYAMVRTQSHKVHLIHNPGKAQMPGGNAMAEIRRAIDLTPLNTGLVLMVISNMFARRITELMLKLTVNPKNFQFVGTVEDARSKIKSQQTSKV